MSKLHVILVSLLLTTGNLKSSGQTDSLNSTFYNMVRTICASVDDNELLSDYLRIPAFAAHQLVKTLNGGEFIAAQNIVNREAGIYVRFLSRTEAFDRAISCMIEFRVESELNGAYALSLRNPCKMHGLRVLFDQNLELDRVTRTEN